MRIIRHLGNVIKHNNSIIDSSYGGISVNELIEKYGFKDKIPINSLDIFKPSIKNSILIYAYMSNEFCYEILKLNGFFSKDRKNLSEEEIIEYMYENYIHSIPGDPQRER